MDHEWHLFYSLRGRLDAVTLPNPSNGALTVAHIRDAIFLRINKVLKDYCVIEINLVDPVTELQLFIGAPLQELLFELDKQHDACGGAPRPRIGSAQRPFKIVMDDQLAKICERRAEEEADKRTKNEERVIMEEEEEPLSISPNTSRTRYSKKPLRLRPSSESVETLEDRMNVYNETELPDGIYNQQIKSSSSAAASPSHKHDSLAIERRSKKCAPSRSRRELIRNKLRATTTTQLLNTPYSFVTLVPPTAEQYAPLPSPVTDSIESPLRYAQRAPRKAAENAKLLLSRLPQKESARDWTEFSALKEKFEIERENEDVRWFSVDDEL
ncbi:hypothetical protein BC937DRAFT_93084 [Endogone sp. FLAS-F59071]|nr:hypothetical protein BC937DRAFT_93084 [Endogone sp. FLAS-F59071]RUS21303.1 hypothetical protein BC937DRAFT_93084 [Endogone sp. FLAS-F59071]|eukprot:RUS21302.1 hypothetical protein BC937DRAFT_93084 [Endogone sp. FLAS-F59071]